MKIIIQYFFVCMAICSLMVLPTVFTANNPFMTGENPIVFTLASYMGNAFHWVVIPFGLYKEYKKFTASAVLKLQPSLRSNKPVSSL